MAIAISVFPAPVGALMMIRLWEHNDMRASEIASTWYGLSVSVMLNSCG